MTFILKAYMIRIFQKANKASPMCKLTKNGRILIIILELYNNI
jgi:hypothetical protein